MSSLSMALRYVNPFTRLYMVTYIPALAALLWVQQYVVALDKAHSLNFFENNFMILLVAVLSIHVARLPAASKHGDWNGFWETIRVVYYVALAAAALRLGYLSMWTGIGIFGSEAKLHYLAVTLFTWAGLPVFFLAIEDR